MKESPLVSVNITFEVFTYPKYKFSEVNTWKILKEILSTSTSKT